MIKEHWRPRSNLGRRIFLLALMMVFSIVSSQTTCFSEGEPGRVLERDCKHQVLFMELGSFVPFFPPHCACFMKEVSVGVCAPSKHSHFPILPLSLSDPLRVHSLSLCTVVPQNIGWLQSRGKGSTQEGSAFLCG